MTSVNELKAKTAHLPPVDPNVTLPAAIRAQAARSAQLHQQTYEEPKQEPDNGGTQGEPQKAQPQEPTPAQAGTQDTPPASPQEPVQPPADNKGRNWENDYNAMKGRYDKLKDDTIPALNGRIAQLEQLLASTATAPKQEQARPASEMKFGKVTDKDREDFGPEFLDAAARAAEDRLGGYISELKAEIVRLGGTVQNAATMTAEQAKRALYAGLDAKLANWRQVNRTPEFIAWTNMVDPFAGVPRIKLLKEAFDNNDTDRVLLFFKSFLTDEATTAPAPGTQTETPLQPGKVPLETFAAPGRAKAPAATTSPGEKELISRAQISKFYLDVQKGVYRGNDAEKARLEQMIFDAERDGRIID